MGQKYHGKAAATTVAGVVQTWDETEIIFDDDDVDVTDQGSLGYRELLSGNRQATLNINGPYNSGSMGLSAGTFYVIKFTVGGSGLSEIAFTATYKVSQIKVRAKASGKDPTTATAVCRSSGAFTPSIT